MRFSERMGIVEPRTYLQKDSIDEPLRNRLWNCLCEYCLDSLRREARSSPLFSNPFGKEILLGEKLELLKGIYHNYYCWPVDSISNDFMEEFNILRKNFFAAEWYDAYEFVEFILSLPREEKSQERLVNCLNRVLEEERSFYRVIDGVVAPITSDDARESVISALRSPLHPVQEQLSKALRALSDKKAPDYAGSIRAAIGALESLCRNIAGDGSRTLGESLPALSTRIGLDPTLKKAIEGLYAYRCARPGVGHGGTQSEAETFDEALLIVVSCSLWINYLTAKARRAGVDFQG